MTDRDDALRRELGWTGPEGNRLRAADTEARTGPSQPRPRGLRRLRPLARRPSAGDDERAAPPSGRWRRRPEPEPRAAANPSACAAVPRPDDRAAVSASPDTDRHRDPPATRAVAIEPPRRVGSRRLAAAACPATCGTGPSATPVRSTGNREAPLYGPDAASAPPPPPASYADRIRVDDLVPARRVPPGRGWRLALYKATFGLVNLGPSPDEIRQAELESKIKSVLRGHYKVGVMGKGGVGKTTVSASVGSVFAELRQDDRVVAIDADTAFGKLGSRVDPKAQGSYWELASDQHLETFADVRSRVGNNAAGLFVLAGEATPARRRVLDPAIYREATSRLDRYFTISIIDCSSTMDTPVTQEVLRDLDALIVVSSPWVDGAAAAGQTMDWLAARGLTNLLQRTVIVLNDSDGHADKRTRSILAQQFASQGQMVVEVPFDGHLRPGGVIDRTSRDVAGHAGAASSRSPLRSPSTSRPATTGAGNATSRSA